jgi:hypothetical protein
MDTWAGTDYATSWRTKGKSGEQTVTEVKWLTCTDPAAMLEYLEGKASDRKRRLFACSCCRYVSDWLVGKESQEAIEVAERYADGLASDHEREAVRSAHQRLARTLMDATGQAAYRAVREVLAHPFGFREIYTWRGAAEAVGETGFVCALVLDIFGNPFRRASTPSATILAWNDAVVFRLAQVAYEERRLPAGTLDTSRLAILADALEEAGCTDAGILDHLRAPGPHVRGCWAVDLCLGKT